MESETVETGIFAMRKKKALLVAREKSDLMRLHPLVHWRCDLLRFQDPVAVRSNAPLRHTKPTSLVTYTVVSLME